MEIDKTRAKRGGRTPLKDPRTHCVSVRLNDEELNILNTKRGKMKQGEWLRCAALDKLPPNIPEPNITKWQELAKAANNLNQIARKLNIKNNPLRENKTAIYQSDFSYIIRIITEYRAALLGVSNNERNAED
jgi:hypothetical protein